MRPRVIQTFVIIVASSMCQASEPASTFGGIGTRSACVENLKGSGSASIIFDAPTKGDYTDKSTANEEFIWDAQLVTESGQIVRVQLHCARTKLPLQQDKGIAEPSQSYVSELVRL